MNPEDETRIRHMAQVEALLFAAEEPRTVRWMANFLKLRGRYVRKLLDMLRREYTERPGALEIREVYKDFGVPADLDLPPGEEPETLSEELPEEELDEQARDLEELDQPYEASDGSGKAPRPKSIPAYHLAVRAEHEELVQRLLPPELSRPVLGTLSVIATRQPILQSDVIRIRGKRAYAHIKDLLVYRLILRKPAEGTYSIQTTQEFQRRYQMDPEAAQRTRPVRSRSAAGDPDAADEVEDDRDDPAPPASSGGHEAVESAA